MTMSVKSSAGGGVVGGESAGVEKMLDAGVVCGESTGVEKLLGDECWGVSISELDIFSWKNKLLYMKELIDVKHRYTQNNSR